MINVLDTLQFMKPDIKVVVWENDIEKIVYNETETFRPTKADILAIAQNLVAAKIADETLIKELNTVTLDEIMEEIINLKSDVLILQGK